MGGLSDCYTSLSGQPVFTARSRSRASLFWMIGCRSLLKERIGLLFACRVS